MSEPVSNGTQYPNPWANTVYNQVDTDLDLKDLMIERGTSGLHRAGGFIREEYLPQLQGKQAVAVYTPLLDRSPVVGSCLFAIEMLIRSVEWHLQPADESAEAQRYADLVHGMLFDDLDMPWPMLLSEILSFLPFGFSFFELTFKRRLGP